MKNTLLNVVLIVMLGSVLWVFKRPNIIHVNQDSPYKICYIELKILVDSIKSHLAKGNPIPMDLSAVIDKYQDDDVGRIAARNDPWGNPYHYSPNPSAKSFTISSAGPNGTLGDEDDVSETFEVGGA